MSDANARPSAPTLLCCGSDRLRKLKPAHPPTTSSSSWTSLPKSAGLQPLEQAMTLLRGYGVRLWLLVQDLAQVRAIYGRRADSLLANAAVFQAFGTNDVQTAEF